MAASLPKKLLVHLSGRSYFKLNNAGGPMTERVIDLGAVIRHGLDAVEELAKVQADPMSDDPLLDEGGNADYWGWHIGVKSA
jgi:hypothetical protein